VHFGHKTQKDTEKDRGEEEWRDDDLPELESAIRISSTSMTALQKTSMD
jgi:hypothetical protein